MFDAFKPAECRGHHVRHSLRAGRICEAHRRFVIRRDRIQYDSDRSTCGPRATLKRGRRGLIMIRKLKSGQYRLYSRKVDPKTGRRRNLGTFSSRAAAEKHERAVQFFKRHG